MNNITGNNQHNEMVLLWLNYEATRVETGYWNKHIPFDLEIINIMKWFWMQKELNGETPEHGNRTYLTAMFQHSVFHNIT